MGTRSTVHFTEGFERPVAIVYRHWDGYPEGQGADLLRFFEDVKEQATDTRFRDPSYLAARFVVYLAGKFADDPAKPLDFLSVGIVSDDPGDIEYRYIVDCALIAGGRPVVFVETVDYDGASVRLGELGDVLRKAVPA